MDDSPASTSTTNLLQQRAAASASTPTRSATTGTGVWSALTGSSGDGEEDALMQRMHNVRLSQEDRQASRLLGDDASCES